MWVCVRACQDRPCQLLHMEHAGWEHIAEVLSRLQAVAWRLPQHSAKSWAASRAYQLQCVDSFPDEIWHCDMQAQDSPQESASGKPSGMPMTCAKCVLQQGLPWQSLDLAAFGLTGQQYNEVHHQNQLETDKGRLAICVIMTLFRLGVVS